MFLMFRAASAVWPELSSVTCVDPADAMLSTCKELLAGKIKKKLALLRTCGFSLMLKARSLFIF